MATSLLHDLDFYAWTQQQVDLLKSGNLVDVDVKHLIEEIESMGASERRELINRLAVCYVCPYLIPRYSFSPSVNKGF